MNLSLLGNFYKINKNLKNKNLSRLLLIPSVILSLTIIGCKNSVSSNRIIVASAGKIESIDPAQANTLRALQLISAIGDPLYRLDKNGNLQPKLAKQLPEVEDNGLSILIPLREDVLFHDGTKFNAKAMKFSLERFIDIGTLNYVIGDRISSIDAAGEYLLKISLTKPSSSLIGLLTSISLTPVSPTAYAEYKDNFMNNAFVGTGPYKLTNFEKEKQRLIPFDQYWGKQAKNGGIDYINFNNSTSLFSAIKTGEVDILLSNSVEDGQRLALHKMANNGKLVEGIGPANEIGYITLRSNIEPLNKKEIRKAISYSLDRKLITNQVSYGLRTPLRTLVPPLLKSSKEALWPKYDPNFAAELLRDQGYCDNKNLNILLTYRSNVPADKLLALTWQEQIKRDLPNCLTLKLNGVESTTVYKQLSEGAFEAVMLDWSGPYPDPEAYLSPLVSCKIIIGEICQEGESVFSGSFWGSKELQESLNKSESLEGLERNNELEKVEKLTSGGGAYLPVWLVKPRAWGQNNLSKPKFDGAGFVILDELHKTK